MQRLQLDPEEKITRKEYLRRKRKQANGLKKRSKITFSTFHLNIIAPTIWPSSWTIIIELKIIKFLKLAVITQTKATK